MFHKGVSPGGTGESLPYETDVMEKGDGGLVSKAGGL